METLLFHLLSIVDASVVEVEDKGKEKNANKTQPSSQLISNPAMDNILY